MAMFLGIPSLAGLKSTRQTSEKTASGANWMYKYTQTGNNNNFLTQTDINAISTAIRSVLGAVRLCVRLCSHWDCVDICFRWQLISTSGFGYCFYFQFVPAAVLQSRTMSMPVEVDQACPKTLQQQLWSPWYRFPSPNYNYFRYPPAIFNFRVKEASAEVGI